MTRDETWLLTEKYGGIESPAFAMDCERLASGEPLAYVIGTQPFLGLTIHLDSHPLIPRPETEWWTNELLNTIAADESSDLREDVGLGQAFQGAQGHLIEEVPQRDDARHSKFSAENYASSIAGVPVRLTFLDLCAGSGAIGCAALHQLPSTQVSFGEIDSVHETTIRQNIRINGLDESRAHIGIGDLFTPFGDMKFDVIASNPPYIPTDRVLDPSVLNYEPSRALLSGTDGLDHIRRISATIAEHLTPQGVAWIECDSAHATAACALFTARGMHVTLRTDQYAIPRVLVVSLRHA